MTQAELGDMTALGRKTPAAEMPRGAVAVRWVVAVAGLVTLGAMLLLNPLPASRLPHFALFAAVMLVAEALLVVRIGPGSYFSISSTFLLVYFSISGAVSAAAMAAVVFFLVWAIQRLRERTVQTLLYALFNVGQQILAVLGGGLTIQLLFRREALYEIGNADPVRVVLVFALVYFLITSALTSLAVYMRTGLSEVRSQLWRTTILWGAISLGVSIPFALVIRLIWYAFGGLALPTLFTFAFLAGISLIVRLNTSLRNGNRELMAINSIGALITATLDVYEIFGIIARESRKVLHWDGFFIALGGRDADQIEMIFMSEAGMEIARRRIPQGAGLTGRAIRAGELVHYEQGEQVRELSPDDSFSGRKRPRALVIAPMKFGDEVIGAICVQSFQSDVYGQSQFRLLQTIAAQAAIAIRNAQLFESEKEAKNERDEFLSLVTHEIKNPLTSINGYAVIGEQAVGANDSDATLDAIKVIRGETAKILRLTEDLLDASKMTAGRFTIVRENLDLVDLVSQIARKHSATSNHKIDLNIAENVPAIEGDPVRLSQVVENLVSNAVKYSPEGSTVTIGLDSSDGLVRLRVRDEGNGIAPDKGAMIFERFYRVEEDGRMVKGTGLGLFISREIVRMHGGDITFESVIGFGTTFLVELPIKAPKPAQQQEGQAGS